MRAGGQRPAAVAPAPPPAQPPLKLLPLMQPLQLPQPPVAPLPGLAEGPQGGAQYAQAPGLIARGGLPGGPGAPGLEWPWVWLHWT